MLTQCIVFDLDDTLYLAHMDLYRRHGPEVELLQGVVTDGSAAYQIAKCARPGTSAQTCETD